jgi:hypothetical protein
MRERRRTTIEAAARYPGLITQGEEGWMKPEKTQESNTENNEKAARQPRTKEKTQKRRHSMRVRTRVEAGTARAC